jgi:hypothetical protein
MVSAAGGSPQKLEGKKRKNSLLNSLLAGNLHFLHPGRRAFESRFPPE